MQDSDSCLKKKTQTQTLHLTQKNLKM